MKVAIVIPTIRRLDAWLEAWESQISKENINLYIVEDRDQKEIVIDKKLHCSVYHFDRTDIKNELGDKAWIIPNFNSGIRSFGFYKAWQDGCGITITLDDDCFPRTGKEIQQHVDAFSRNVDNHWFNTISDLGIYPRGFPYFEERKTVPVVLNHGLWDNILDLDAPTQLQYADRPMPKGLQTKYESVPRGYYFPMCIMNLSFKTGITPIMYQLLMGKNWEYDRFDDIWSGIIIKKILDHLGYGVTSGAPIILHNRASNVFDNLVKEAKGIRENESLWKKIDSIQLTEKTLRAAYKELWEKLDPWNEYFTKLKEASLLWLQLFQ